MIGNECGLDLVGERAHGAQVAFVEWVDRSDRQRYAVQDDRSMFAHRAQHATWITAGEELAARRAAEKILGDGLEPIDTVARARRCERVVLRAEPEANTEIAHHCFATIVPFLALHSSAVTSTQP